jgi:hypothetical protein
MGDVRHEVIKFASSMIELAQQSFTKDGEHASVDTIDYMLSDAERLVDMLDEAVMEAAEREGE